MRAVPRSRKIQFIGLAVVALVVIGTSWVALRGQDNNTAEKPSDAQLRTELGCDRSTLEYRETDIFCDNLALYRQLVGQGITFGDSSSSPTTQIVLITANQKPQPVADASTELVAKNDTIWSGTTDPLGVIEVPRDKITNGVTIVSGDLSGTVENVDSAKAAYVVLMQKPSAANQ